MSLLPRLTFLATFLALGAIEGLAWWWMNPAPTDPGEPVLAYRPEIRGQVSVGRDPARAAHLSPAARNADGEPEIRGQEEAPASAPGPAQGSSPNPQSTIHNHQSEISSSSPNLQSPISNLSSFTPLPEIYRQAAPMLRCTSGQVFHVKISDTASLHGAFFEWDGTDTGSVLEAFRHMPEACMGSIGMQLVSKEKPIPYTVGLALRAGRDSANGEQSQGIANSPAHSTPSTFGVGSSKFDVPSANAAAQGTSSSSNQKLSILNLSRQSAAATDHQSSIQLRSQGAEIVDSGSEIVDENDLPSFSVSSLHPQSTIHNPRSTISLLFDHTVFRDPGQSANPLLPAPLVHAFRAVWVSGIPSADARKGLDGQEFDQLRTIRLKAALTRFRPTHARVVQGAVRGMHSPQAAWQTFEQHMLRNLTFER